MYQNISEMVIGTKGKSNCHDMGAKGINPYVAEHTKLLASIRGDGPYVNEAMEVANSTMTCIMARESAYSGQEITWDQIMNFEARPVPQGVWLRREDGLPAGACPRRVQVHLGRGRAASVASPLRTA